MAKKILLVEDDLILGKLYQRKFQNSGFSVAVALDGQEGLLLMRSGNPDLVVLDLLMPRMDGFAFLEALAADTELAGRKTPVIVLSNLGTDDDIRRAKELHATDFFVKADTSLDQMVETVRRYVEKE
ncbi:response regulator [Patescibacteria group bacterium]|nr:response regulator [Patescibacteria group bacterium]